MTIGKALWVCGWAERWDWDNGIEGKRVSSVESVKLWEEEAQAITVEAGLAQSCGEAQTRY